MITIHALELRNLLRARPDLVLLNVRPAGSYAEGSLPGSRHIPYTELALNAKAMLLDQDAVIVVYGADFTCETSTRAAEILEGLGYTSIYNFSAGLKGWKEAGFPLDFTAQS